MADTMTPPAPAVPAVRKPRRWLRRVALLVAALLVLGWFAPTLLVKAGLLNTVVAKATAQRRTAVSRPSNGTFSTATTRRPESPP